MADYIYVIDYLIFKWSRLAVIIVSMMPHVLVQCVFGAPGITTIVSVLSLSMTQLQTLSQIHLAIKQQ